MAPTCPGWNVTDLACHLYGVADDLMNGRLEGIGSDAWTQAQVDRYSTKPLADIADEWAASAEVFDAIVPMIPEPTNYQLIMDMTTHEHDLRLALGEPGAQDDQAVAIGSAFLLLSLRNADPDLAAEIEGLELSDFELLRSLSGRRSAGQLERAGIPPKKIESFLSTTPMTISAVDVDEVPSS